MSDDLFHKIDKELAVLKALSNEHHTATSKDLKELKEAVQKLQLKVAVISATISLCIGAISVWLK